MKCALLRGGTQGILDAPSKQGTRHIPSSRCLCCVAHRLEDDERLDTILEGLRRRAPDPRPASHTKSGSTGAAATQEDDVQLAKADASATKQLASNLAEVRGHLRGLEDKLNARRGVVTSKTSRRAG
jgi:hypothetical protein